MISFAEMVSIVGKFDAITKSTAGSPLRKILLAPKRNQIPRNLVSFARVKVSIGFCPNGPGCVAFTFYYKNNEIMSTDCI